MKKILTLIISGLILSLGILSGCSCSTAKELIFADNWSNSASIGYAETAVYEVTLDQNFTYGDFGFIKSQDLADDKIEYDYKGTYTSSLKTYAKEVVSSLDGVKDCGSPLLQEISPIIHLKTTLNLTASFKFGNMTEKKEYTDTIVTDSFFSNANTSLTPIYTTEQREMSHLIYDTNTKEFAIRRFKVNSTTVFDKNTYKLNRSIVEITDPSKPSEAILTDKTYNYTLRTVIDNSQLLFALRNYDIAFEQGTYLRTVSNSHEGEAKDLYVSNFSQTDLETPNLTLNGTQLASTTKVPVNVYSFQVGSNYSGVAQLEFIQRKPDSTTISPLPTKSMMVKYVEPLLTSGGSRMQGALVYNLKSFTYGN